MGDPSLPLPEDCLIPDEIRTAARLGKLAFFVGNGISQLYGVPSWEGLTAKMLKALADHGVINHNKIALLSRYSLKARVSIADHYFKKSAVREKGLSYSKVLEQNLDSRATAYAALAKCGAKFITTNYDSLLYQALEGGASASEVVKDLKVSPDVQDSDQTIGRFNQQSVQRFIEPEKFSRLGLLQNKTIFHLHGSIVDENTIISSTDHYLRLYANEDVRSFLSWFFEKNTVVFLGYGLEELELLDLIVRAGGKSAVDNPRSFYLLLPLLSQEVEILEQLRIYYDQQLGITIVPFSRDEKDYGAWGDLLERWSGELSQIVQDPMKVDSFELMERLIAEAEGAAP